MFLLPQNYWKIKKVTKKGRGVFALRDIKAGTIIGDYIGIVIPSRDDDKYDNDGHSYLMYYHDRASIYPDLEKPGVHIINHSCTPNTWMYTYKGHTLYFAIRRILKSEEITVSYLYDEQDKDCNPCTHLCFCESIMCIGTMHMSKDRYDKWSKLSEKEEKRTKHARVRYGRILPHLTSYPKLISDNPFAPLFGYEKAKPEIMIASKLPTLREIRKMIRETGRTLKFPKLNIRVLGVADGIVISKSID